MKRKHLVYAVFLCWCADVSPVPDVQNFELGAFLGNASATCLISRMAALIYLAYVVRAIRWKIFLKRCVRKQRRGAVAQPSSGLQTGTPRRPGELIRPYLIARRHDLSFSSQMRCGRWNASSTLAPTRSSRFCNFRGVALRMTNFN